MQEYSTPQNRLYFTFRKAVEGGRKGKGFPHFATNTEQNKTALQYVQSTFSGTAKVELQTLHEHLQHVQTNNSARAGAALYTSPACAPNLNTGAGNGSEARDKHVQVESQIYLSPWQQKDRVI